MNKSAQNPALALLEYSSIAAGTRASDALLKKAKINILRAGTLQPGRYAILFDGDLASVELSFLEGRRVGAAEMIDGVLLPDVDDGVRAALLGRTGDWSSDTIGIIETTTLAATVRAADAAVKGAEVEVVQIRLGDGLGGKGLAHFAGTQADVEAAIEIGIASIADRAQPPATAIIPRFDDDLRDRVGTTTRFGEDV